MEMLTNPLSDAVPISFKLVLLTIILVAILLLLFWVVRKFTGSPTIKPPRGRLPRLAVTDAANLDDKRRLVLIRRDNIEHLVMIGGATDVLIESNIAMVKPVQTQPENIAQPAKSEQKLQAPQTHGQSPIGNAVVSAAGLSAATGLAASETKPPEEIRANRSFDDILKTANPTTDTPAEELNADLVSNLEDALGVELADTSQNLAEPVIPPPVSASRLENSTIGQSGQDQTTPDQYGSRTDRPEQHHIDPPRMDQPRSQTAPVRVTQPAAQTTSGIITPTHPRQKGPQTEDQMQKLLDELTGEKN